MAPLQDNINKVNELRESLLSHPMCLRLEESPASAIVIFPGGDFPVDGLKIRYTKGKAHAFVSLLDRMEQMWLESFPGYEAKP